MKSPDHFRLDLSIVHHLHELHLGFGPIGVLHKLRSEILADALAAHLDLAIEQGLVEHLAIDRFSPTDPFLTHDIGSSLQLLTESHLPRLHDHHLIAYHAVLTE